MNSVLKILCFISGFILSLIALYWSQLFYLHNFIDAKQARLYETFVLLSPLKKEIEGDLINNQFDIHTKSYSYSGHPQKEREQIDYFHLYPNGDIYYHTKQNQLVLLHPTFDEEKQETLQNITWVCFAAPKSIVPSECRMNRPGKIGDNLT